MKNSNHLIFRVSSGPTAVPEIMRYVIGISLLALGTFAVIDSFIPLHGINIPPQVAVPLGLAFAGTGAYLLWGRFGATIDKRDSTVKTWWGLLIPFHQTGNYTTNECTVVTITKELRSTRSYSSGDSGSSRSITYTVYPVRLKRKKGNPILAAESRRYLASRVHAEAIANFLGLGITDRTGGTTLVREAGTLDLSLSERLKTSGKEINIPPKPGTCNIEQDIQGRSATFTIPAAGFGFMEYLLLGFGGILFLGGFIFCAAVGNQSGDVFLYVLPIAGTITGIALIIKAIKESMTIQEVTVSQHGLAVKQRGPMSFGNGVIPAHELEDLVLGHVGGKMFSASVLLARSDRAVMVFGKGIDPPDQEWLLAVIQQALVLTMT